MYTQILIIGAGVTGCAVARVLSRYEADVTVVDRGADVAEGASKANSGIIHAGYDAVPGTKKAYYNVRGAQMLPELSRRLDFEFEQRGSLLVCFDPQRLDELEAAKEEREKLIGQGEEELAASRRKAKEMEQKVQETATYPYVVVKTEYMEKNVIFQ